MGPATQPLVIIGEGWSQQFIFTNTSYAGMQATVGALKFWTKDGRAWKVPLKNQGSLDYVTISLGPGKTVILETEVSWGQQQLGWASFALGYDANQQGPYHAFSVFRKQVAGQPDLMTSVPFVGGDENEWIVPFDNEDGKYPGIGLVNKYQFSSTVIELEVVDLNGMILKHIRKTVGPMSLAWFSLVGENPELASKRGLMRIKGGTSSAAFTLQFAPNGAFTALPVVHTYGIW